MRRDYTVMTHLVMPNDANHLGNLMGGNLMRWMDICAAVCGTRHCSTPVVTVSADSLIFKGPIRVGEVTTIEARVTRVFSTSLEVYIDVWAEEFEGKKRKCNEAFFTFVAIDKDTKLPVKAPSFEPVTKEEIALFDSARRRRELRMIMAGRIRPDEAGDLKKLFTKN